MAKHVVLTASLLGLPLLASAQEAVPKPHFYLGVGASAVTYFAAHRPTALFTGTLIGPRLSLGAHLTPRLSLELGAAYAWPGKTTAMPDANGQPSTSYSTVRLHALSIPLLLRYDFWPASRRWHVEGLGGITVRTAREYYAYHYINYAGAPVASESVDYATGLGLTLGPAVRYSLSPRFDLTAEPLLSAELTHYDYNGIAIPEIQPQYPFRHRLFWNFQAGVRYNFLR